jgi:hypothetical protein
MGRALLKPTKPRTETSLEQLRKHRIIRVRRQNEALELSLKRTKGELVNADELKQEVIRCNQVVRTQLLALPYRLAAELVLLTEVQEVQRVLYTAIVACCNDLAYAREQPPPPNVCPSCGHRK